MAVSVRRLTEILNFYKLNGEEKTVNYCGISHSSLERYLRAARQLDLLDEKPRIPKILLFDLETSPYEYYTWGCYQQFIPPEFKIKGSAILTWSAKWLCDDTVLSAKVSAKEAENRTDSSVIQGLWDLFEEADILIAHNLCRFDVKVANTRFLANGLQPPSPYRMVDTLTELRKKFRLESNKLTEVNKFFGLSDKLDTRFDLWRKVVTGCKESMDYMLEYNEQDVRALEELYLTIRPWINSHPNLALYYDDWSGRCSNCGSVNLIKKGVYYTTNANKYQALRCKDCGAYMRERKGEGTKIQKENLLCSIAR